MSPANISRPLEGIFSKNFPDIKPRQELINVINPINNTGFSIVLPDNDNEIPAEKASILVARPINNKHTRLIHDGFFFDSKDSLMNFKPKNIKMVKIIIPEYGEINSFT